ARAEDQVDHVVATGGLGQPVWKRHLRRAAARRQQHERALDVARVNEDVEVLGVPADAGIPLEGVGAADEERDAAALQLVHDAAIEGAGDGIERSLGDTHAVDAAGSTASWGTGISSNLNGGRPPITARSSGSDTL